MSWEPPSATPAPALVAEVTLNEEQIRGAITTYLQAQGYVVQSLHFEGLKMLAHAKVTRAGALTADTLSWPEGGAIRGG